MNVKLQTISAVSETQFSSTPGYELDFDLFAPSSMIGWELSERTRFNYQANTQSYVIDGIPIDVPLQDKLGHRFKITSHEWIHQFGFGSYVPRAESSFGVTRDEVILNISLLKEPSTDLYVKFQQNDDSRGELLLRLEIKVIENTAYPKAYFKANLYTVNGK